MSEGMSWNPISTEVFAYLLLALHVYSHICPLCSPCKGHRDHSRFPIITSKAVTSVLVGSEIGSLIRRTGCPFGMVTKLWNLIVAMSALHRECT